MVSTYVTCQWRRNGGGGGGGGGGRRVNFAMGATRRARTLQ